MNKLNYELVFMCSFAFHGWDLRSARKRKVLCLSHNSSFMLQIHQINANSHSESVSGVSEEISFGAPKFFSHPPAKLKWGKQPLPFPPPHPHYPSHATVPAITETSSLSRPSWFWRPPTLTNKYAVSGQNTIGRELTLLALIQYTVYECNIVDFNWLLKLLPAVMLQDCRIIVGCNSTNRLLHTVFCFFTVDYNFNNWLA